MDQGTRNKLRNVVTQCRQLLEDAVAQVLQGQFGIYASGKRDEVHIEDEVRMAHLSDEDRAYRKDILGHFEHIKAFGAKPKDALDQLVRAIAFTHLNRLCAYKMMETRGLIREAVSRELRSQGFMFYLADHPEDEQRSNTGQQDIAYRHFLDWLGSTLSEEIGVLFNPNDPANRLYPPQRVLDDVLVLINDKELAGIWLEDETIGWVYQYFTPKELRDQARKESAAPRNSYELAFRNQFFTPRYVVEFLTDNTLGRIWYEMRRGDTKLTDQCRYMVHRPNEHFLEQGQTAPQDAEESTNDLSQEELLKQPVYIAYRPKKDPRDLKILDPACGSGHFLLYCFDLLLTIYEEAYNDPDLRPVLRKDYATLEEFQRVVPGLILSHNLHGIDIDIRATQIAALALWLRCQRAYQEFGLTRDRPKITRSNIVCAEPMPGEKGMLEEFVAELQPNVLGQLVEVVFERMKLAGEAGSLLKIEEDIADALAEAKKQWLSRPQTEQLTLWSEEKRPKAEQLGLFDISGITDEEFWHEAEARVFEALHGYARHAASDARLQRQLFAEDTIHGFAFVELCRKRFDVVLMNPPFGSPSLTAEAYLHSAYHASQYECYGQFLARAVTLCSGYIGAITSRAFLYLANFKSIREFIYPHLRLFLDLGEGILDDAMVEVCAYTMSSPEFLGDVYCYDARKISLATLNPFEISTVIHSELPAYRFSLHHLDALENMPFCYSTEPVLLKMFGTNNTFETILGGLAKVGLATGDNDRFVRCYWEVPRTSINARWRWYAKGGDYLPFKPDVHLVVDWFDEGKSIEQAFVGARIKKTDVYFRPGVTYSRRSLKGLSFRALPAGCICSDRGPVIIAPGYEYAVLALVNSRVFKYLVEIQCAFGAYEIGTIQRTPLPSRFLEISSDLADLGRSLLMVYSSLACIDETDVLFQWDLFDGKPTSIADISKQVSERIAVHRQKAAELLWYLDEKINQAYEIESLPDNIAEHEKMLEVFSTPDCDEMVSRLTLSVCLGFLFGHFPEKLFQLKHINADFFDHLPQGQMLLAMQGNDEATSNHAIEMGIIPGDPDHPDDIIRRVRWVLELVLQEQAEAIEKEICEILHVKQLRDYFQKPGIGGFWDDHIRRYSKSRRKAPIYWLLQSSKKNYALWLYYHRLDKDILFKALLYYVEPKIRLEESRLESLRSQRVEAGTSGRGAKKLAKDIDRQEEFISELRDFEEKLRRVANLHLDPDLNDGVVLNIAPLRELVPWKEAKTYWDELLAGKYEWSSICKQLREKGIVHGP